MAPRVTLADIEAAIVDEVYFTGAQGSNANDQEPSMWAHDKLELLTFCILVLRNGYTIVGKSACVSAANFNAEIGRKVAREDAINQAWPLFGFHLAEELYRTNQPDV